MKITVNWFNAAKSLPLSFALVFTLAQPSFSQTRLKVVGASPNQSKSAIANEALTYAKEYYQSALQVCDGKILVAVKFDADFVRVIQILEPQIAVFPNTKEDAIAKLNNIEWRSVAKLRVKAFRILDRQGAGDWGDWIDGAAFSEYADVDPSIQKRDGKWSSIGRVPPRLDCLTLTDVNKPTVAPTPADLVTKVFLECPNSKAVVASVIFPPEAIKNGVVVEDFSVGFTIGTDGKIRDPAIVGAADRYLAEAALSAVRQFRCTARKQEEKVQMPFEFRLDF